MINYEKKKQFFIFINRIIEEMGSSPMKDVHEETKKVLALKVRDSRLSQW